MTAVPNSISLGSLTESEAYNLIRHNWRQGKLHEKATQYNLKVIDELKRLTNIGLVLGLPNPASKNSELYKLVKDNWSEFSELGCTQDFTYLLSYKAIVFILDMYGFDLNIDLDRKTAIPIKATVNFTYTEEQSEAILKHNLHLLESKIGKLNRLSDMLRTTMLTKLLNFKYTYYLYNLLEQYLPKLELLGCTKTGQWKLTYRGVLFLLLEKQFPLNLDKTSTAKVVYIQSRAKEVDENKLIKDFLTKKAQELKAKAEEDKEKAKLSAVNLKKLEDVLWYYNQAEELLEEIEL